MQKLESARTQVATCQTRRAYLHHTGVRVILPKESGICCKVLLVSGNNTKVSQRSRCEQPESHQLCTAVRMLQPQMKENR